MNSKRTASEKKVRAMNSCIVCKRYSAFCDDEGLCERCAKLKPLILRFVTKKGMVPVKTDGQIMSEDDWYRLQIQVNRFYANYDQEWIDEENAKAKELTKWKAKHKNKAGIPGYIYLLKASNGYYKIGRAVNVETRLKGHLRMYPLKIRILHTIRVPDTVKSESYLLKQFEDYKLQGEWFALEKEHVDYICNLTSDELIALVEQQPKQQEWIP